MRSSRRRPLAQCMCLGVARKSRPAIGTADQANERTGSSDARIGGFGDGTLDGSDGWKQLGWSWGMTASIPGENDTKRHRIALAALPSSCQPATLCRRQNPVECRRTECPWYIGRRRPRIILVHARRAAHTREMHGSSDSTYSTQNCSAAALVHSADSRIFRCPQFPQAESKPARREESID